MLTDKQKTKAFRMVKLYLSKGVSKSEAIEATLTGYFPGSKAKLWPALREYLNYWI